MAWKKLLPSSSYLLDWLTCTPAEARQVKDNSIDDLTSFAPSFQLFVEAREAGAGNSMCVCCSLWTTLYMIPPGSYKWSMRKHDARACIAEC